jgi:hypothetical protein
MCVLKVLSNYKNCSTYQGPADERNIKGVVMNVNEHGGYNIGTKVGQIK